MSAGALTARRTSVVFALFGILLGLLTATAPPAAAASTPGQVTTYNIGAYARDLAAGADGLVWTTSGKQIIGVSTASGAVARTATVSNSYDQIGGVAVGPDASVWFTATHSGGSPNAIGRLRPDGSILYYFVGISSNSGSVSAIVMGPDGRVWFMEANNRIGVLDPVNGPITEYALPYTCDNLTSDPAGYVWMYNCMSGHGAITKFGRIQVSSGQVDTYDMGSSMGPGGPSDIAIGPDGAVWYAQSGNPPAASISKWYPGGATSTYQLQYAGGGLTFGADGGLWVVESVLNGATVIGTQMERLDPATGTTTVYPVPASVGLGYPVAVTDGSLWGVGQGKTLNRFSTSVNPTVSGPAISGQPYTGFPLKCTGDTWAVTPTARTYAWLRLGTAAPVGTGLTYVPTAADAGHSLTCRITATLSAVLTPQIATSGPLAISAAPTLAVTDIQPRRGSTLGGDTVTVTGSGFVDGAIVEFGVQEATDVQVVSGTQLTAVTPPGTAGQIVYPTVTNADGSTTTSPVAFYYDPPVPPRIYKLVPSSGPAAGGTEVEVKGDGFTQDSTVTFDGQAASVADWAATALFVTTPPGTPGSVDVTVSGPGGTTTLASAYTYTGPPTITAVDPPSGDDAGGTVLTIKGSGFTESGASVTVGGNPATNVSAVSGTRITATTPAGTAGTVPVIVTNQWGSAVLQNGFTYVQTPPVVTGITPDSGTALGGTQVTVAGTGFQDSATVTIGGRPATSVQVTGPTSLTATTPRGNPGTATVVVTNPDGGQGADPGAFTYISAPTVSAVSPPSGDDAGGTYVTITGTAFAAGMDVTFGNEPAESVNVVSSTTLRVQTPAAPNACSGFPCEVDMVLTNSDGGSVTVDDGFTFVVDPPQVTGISPASGSVAGGTEVTIAGSGFQNGAEVSFGNKAATDVTVTSGTRITATAPQVTSGRTVSITVTNPDSGTGTLDQAYIYLEQPLIQAVQPTSGLATGGTTITITGFGFEPGTAVTVGGQAATDVEYGSSTWLTAVTPAGQGVADVVITDPDGETAILTHGFTYIAAPTITAVTPDTGTTGGGTTVTITGTGFTQGAEVSFGKQGAAEVTVSSATKILAVTPPSDAAAVDVQVSNPDGQSDTVPDGFTYASPAPTPTPTPTPTPVIPTTLKVTAKVLKNKRVRLTITASPADGRTAEVYRRAPGKWVLVKRAPRFPDDAQATVTTVMREIKGKHSFKVSLPATSTMAAAKKTVTVRVR